MKTTTAVRKTTVKTTVGVLLKRLFELRGTTFIQLHTTTEARMNKGGRENSNRLHGKVVKDSTTNCIIGFSYENMINNARKRELSADVKTACIDAGVPADILDQFESEVENMVDKSITDFVAKSRQWGNHVQTGLEFNIETCKFDPIFSKTMVEHEKDGEHRYYVQVAVLNSQDPVYKYADTGKELSEDDREYMKLYTPKKKEGERQELKKPIIIRDYRVDNVKRMHLNKVIYITE